MKMVVYYKFLSLLFFIILLITFFVKDNYANSFKKSIISNDDSLRILSFSEMESTKGGCGYYCRDVSENWPCFPEERCFMGPNFTCCPDNQPCRELNMDYGPFCVGDVCYLFTELVACAVFQCEENDLGGCPDCWYHCDGIRNACGW